MEWTEERVATVGNDPSLGGSLTATFVVRLWEAPTQAAGESGGLRGVVHHARSGRSATFTDGESLLAFLHTTGHVSEPKVG